MNIAVTYENGQIFQHFGHTKQFNVYEIESNTVRKSYVADTNGQGHGEGHSCGEHAHGLSHSYGSHSCH